MFLNFASYLNFEEMCLHGNLYISSAKCFLLTGVNYRYLSQGTRVHMFLVVLNDSRSHFTLICWKVHLTKF